MAVYKVQVTHTTVETGYIETDTIADIKEWQVDKTKELDWDVALSYESTTVIDSIESVTTRQEVIPT
jgi:hypothetical protein